MVNKLKSLQNGLKLNKVFVNVAQFYTLLENELLSRPLEHYPKNLGCYRTKLFYVQLESFILGYLVQIELTDIFY